MKIAGWIKVGDRIEDSQKYDLMRLESVRSKFELCGFFLGHFDRRDIKKPGNPQQ